MPVRRPVCLICLIFLLAVYVVTNRSGPYPSWDVDRADNRTVTVTGTVSDRQYKNGSFHIYLKNVRFISDQTYFPKTSKGILVMLKGAADGSEAARIGSRIGVTGVFAPFDKKRCEGMFDTRAYYMIRGCEGRLIRAKITGVSSKYSIFPELLRQMREKACNILMDNMNREDASLMAAMTLGDKSSLDSEIKELYQNAGISHVLALSGLHIASVGLALLALLRKMRLPSVASSVTAFSVIALYAVMTGMSVSTIRAMIMFGLFVLSDCAGRTYDIMSAAALSAVIIVVFNPRYIYDTGFLLSFGAIIGIVFIYPVLAGLPDAVAAGARKTERESTEKKRRHRGIADAAVRIYRSMCISISVTIATLPVSGMSFMQISLCSVFINLLVIPLMSIVLLTGFAGIITGVIGIKPYVILKIPHYILALYRLLGETSEKIDGNTFVIGTPATWQTVTHAIILIFVVITANNTRNDKHKNNARKINIDRAGRRYFQNNVSDRKISENKITYTMEKFSERTKKRRKNILNVIITIAMLAVSFAVFTFHPREKLEIRNVDVGQGDCALIWGKDIPVIMIDGGSSDVKSVGKYRIVPVLKSNRITSIDDCFLTHMDSDHVNGVIEMLEDDTCPVKIKRIFVSTVVLSGEGHIDEVSGSSDTDSSVSSNMARLRKAAEKRKTAITGISAGDIVSCRDFKITCVSPNWDGIAASGSKVSSTDENDCSLVLEAEYERGGAKPDFLALFTGDISENTEEGILEHINDCDYLKVAHHGSRYSSSYDFLKRARPEISVISAGTNNRYGHPHSETLNRLDDIGSRIFNTMDTGEIIFTLEDDGVSCRPVVF